MCPSLCLSLFLRRVAHCVRPLLLSLSLFAGPALAQPADVFGRIHAILEKGSLANFDTRDLDVSALRSFYEKRSYQPAWTGSAAAERDAKLVLSNMERADEDGLETDKYHLRELSLRRQAVTMESAAEYDLLLTDGVLRYARDLRVGRQQLRALDRDVGLSYEGFNPAPNLDWALRNNRLADFLGELATPHAEYGRLKNALVRYRGIAAQGDWPKVTVGAADDLTIATPETALLRQRLAFEDDMLAANPDSELAAAVQRFQRRNGLEADGRVGPKTLLALNTPASERAMEIVANMERWRWVPRSFGPRYIEVNAADATLQVVDNGKVVLFSRVIVGKPSTRTAIFAATVTDITVNPYWNIPPKIARNEIQPKARRNPNYLAKNHIYMDSSGMFRQLPGPKNSLGLLKLEMPNRFDAYLHDTPARKLFAGGERHLSHGCIRVEQIQPLASFALTEETALGLEKVQAAIASGDNQRISLDNPLPVYVLYWTAIANQDGTVDFRSDVYGRDQKLIAALAGQRLMGRVTMNSDNACRKA